MLELRDYQRAAVDSVFEYWRKEAGSPLVVVPTGGGKSLIIATFIRELLEGWPDMRILCVTHVKELLVQNAQELLGLWPFAPIGFFSAGLGRREGRAQIIFGGVQTITRKAAVIGHIDLVLVDEAHLIPRNSETQYGVLLDGLRAINPDMKMVGLTATPYRMGEGLLHKGDDAIFDAIAFEKPVGELIDGGYLCRPISKGMSTGYDLTGVGKVGGDYNQGKLQAAVDGADINRAVVDEVMGYGADRKAWLLFCSGVDHAFHMRDEIRGRGISCETVTGETPPEERDKIIADFKAGRLRALTNNSVLTTGTNIPAIDLIAFCRPTLSAGLYLQMAGRGLRLHPGKANCLFLDFAGIVRKHGPIDAVTPPREKGEKGKGDGEAPVKLCPPAEGGCGSLVHSSVRACPDCGHEFHAPTELNIDTTAADLPMLSKDAPAWRHVDERRFHYHEGKGGKPPSVKVAYIAKLNAINEWMCPQHTGYAQAKAHRYWAKHGGQRPFPKTVMEWLERQNELLTTAQISVRPDGKYWTVCEHMPGDARQHVEPEPEPAYAGGGSIYDDLDDEIPF
jgi:DNA repair protein RadD